MNDKKYRNIEMTALDLAVIEEDEQNSIVLQCRTKSINILLCKIFFLFICIF